MNKLTKQLLVGMIAFGAALGALAQVTQTSAAVDIFTTPADFRDTMIEAHNKSVVDVGAVISKANAAVVGDTITSSVSTADRVGTVTVTNSLETAVHMVGWLSATAGGVATDTSLTSVVAGANTTVMSAAGSSTVVFVCHTDGVAVLTVTVDADVDRYFNVVQRNGTVHSTAIMALAE